MPMENVKYKSTKCMSKIPASFFQVRVAMSTTLRTESSKLL